MRCSVQTAMKLSDEDFDHALTAAMAQNIARPHVIERERQREMKKKKDG